MNPLLDRLLRQYWQFDNFRPGQREIVQTVANGRDVLALLPTGGGKSLCYQLAGLALQQEPGTAQRKGLTLVVSPLIALMDDQVAALRLRGLRAGAIHSGVDTPTQQRLLREAGAGQLDFLFLAPERLGSEAVRLPLLRWPVVLLAVDEAHCISQWGYDFRPAYRRIREAQTVLTHVPVLALTATATPTVQRDIVVQLGLRDAAVLTQPVSRPNLRYAVVQAPDRHAALHRALSKVPGSALIYTRSRTTTEELAQHLRQQGIEAAAYHAGMPTELRQAVQQDWMANRTRVVVATTAFGMGIDKPDVRLVLHWHLPSELESYYQEAGRAGRDEHLSYCILLYEPHEASKHQRHLDQAWPDDWAVVPRFLGMVYDAARMSTGTAPPSGLFRLPVQQLAAQVGMPFPAAQRLLLWLSELGWLRVEQASGSEGELSLQLLHEGPELLRMAETHPVLESVLIHILRQVGGQARHEAQPVALTAWAMQLGLKDQELHRRLQRMAQLGWLKLSAKADDMWLTFLQPRPSRWTPHLVQWEGLEALRNGAQERLAALRTYLDNRTVCRQLLLRRYFGEAAHDPCGQCDVCLGRSNPPAESAHPQEELQNAFIHVLRRGPVSYTRLLEQVPAHNNGDKVTALRHLAHSGRIQIGADYLVTLTEL